MRQEISLKGYLLRKALPRQAGILLALSIILGALFYFYSQPQIESKHQNDLNRLKVAIDEGLSGTLGQMRNLAANDFVVNSLVDLKQQQYYLTLFFQSLRINNDDDASIAFFNFEGDLIASKNYASLADALQLYNWQEPVLVDGEEQVYINKNGVTLAVPVYFSGDMVEGALVFHSSSLAKLILYEQGSTKQVVLDSNNNVLFATENSAVAIGSPIEPSVFADNLSRHKMHRQLKIVSFESYAGAYTRVLYLAPFLALTILFALFSSLSSTLSVAKMGAATLVRLQQRISSGFNDAHRTDNSIRSITELTNIHQAFETLKDEVLSLSLSNDRVTGVIDAVLELMLVVDNDNKVILRNRACKEFMALAHIEENYLINIIGELDDSDAPNEIKKIEKTYSYKGSGQVKVVQWYVTPLVDKENKTVGQVVVGEDLTLRKTLESDLLLKTQAVDRASTSILISDMSQPGEPIIYVNKACETLTGYSEDEFIGRNCRFLQGPETNQDDIQRIRDAIDKREPVDVTLLNYRKDGTQFYNYLSLTPIKNDDGSCTHYLGIQQDVTASTQTAQFLQEAKQKAEESSRMKADFLANMSHEIRTPINGMYGVLQLLETTKLNGKQAEFVDMAMRSTKSLLHIVNDILDLSKIEAGKLDIENLFFDPHQFFNEVSESYSFHAREKQIQFTTHITIPDDVIICADPTRIRQVVENLLSNAIKFTNQGKIDCYVVLSGNAPSGTLTISVKDTGVGISKHKLSTIFEHFAQEDVSTTREFGGTGLGLAITHQLCELMGGDIKVVSKKGHGSVFAFTVPVKIGHSAQTDNAPQRIESTKAIEDKQSIRVLLVEDNEINQAIAKSHLQGYDVTLTENGQLALNAIEQSTKPYDVILMDCQMPVMDGFEAARKIRSGAAGKKAMTTPIIALTANAMKGDKELCIKAGMDDYISKPFEASELLAKVNKWSAALH